LAGLLRRRLLLRRVIPRTERSRQRHRQRRREDEYDGPDQRKERALHCTILARLGKRSLRDRAGIAALAPRESAIGGGYPIKESLGRARIKSATWFGAAFADCIKSDGISTRRPSRTERLARPGIIATAICASRAPAPEARGRPGCFTIRTYFEHDRP